MRFCIQCNNMYYIRLSDNDGGNLIYYCRNCGNEENIAETDVDNLCISINNTTQCLVSHQKLCNHLNSMYLL